MDDLLNDGANLLDNLSHWGSRGRGNDGRGSRGSCYLRCAATNLNKVGLDFTGLGVPHDSGGVANHDQVSQRIDVAVFTSHIDAIARFLVGNVGLFIVVGHLVGVGILGVIVKRLIDVVISQSTKGTKLGGGVGISNQKGQQGSL